MDKNLNLGPGFWSYGQKGPKWLEIRKLPKFLESFLFFALRPIGRHGVSSQTAAGTQDQGHKLFNVVLNVASSRKCVKTAKNGNDLGDLDFDLVTLRSIGDHDLVHTYL